MKEIIKKGVLNSLIGAIITFTLTYVTSFIVGPAATIELTSIEEKSNEYYTTISIKNMQNYEYLKSIEFTIEPNVKIKNVLKNGEPTAEKNKIKIDKLKPQEITIISLITNKKVTPKNLHLIKNKQRIEYSYFNNKQSVSIYYVLLVFVYAVINFILFSYFSVKDNEKIQSFHKELEKSEIKAKECDERIENTKNNIRRIERKQIAQQLIYTKEINDLKKEKEFYQKLLLKIHGDKLNKEKLEEMIKTELKVFSKTKRKSQDYEELVSLVDKMLENEIVLRTLEK